MERDDKIRGNRNLNRWGRIPDLMEAGNRIGGNECLKQWKRKTNFVGVNVEIVHSVGTAQCNSHCSVLHQPSQHAAFGSAAHWLLLPPHLPMARQFILTTTTPLLITEGRQINIPEKTPCTNDRSNCSPRSQLARCSVMRTSGQLVISSGFSCDYGLSAFLCVSVSISTGSGRL